MNAQEIEKSASKALEGSSEMYLHDIVSHGIHNITNEFHGETDEDYETYAEEFKKQAAEILG